MHAERVELALERGFRGMQLDQAGIGFRCRADASRVIAWSSRSFAVA